MKALLLVAHGSRRVASNDEVRELTKKLSKEKHHYNHVDCAFLELSEPSIPNGLRSAIKAGAKEIIVLPYFLSAGRHVAEDIPEEVAIVQSESPEVSISIAPYLGHSHGLTTILLEQATLHNENT